MPEQSAVAARDGVATTNVILGVGADGGPLIIPTGKRGDAWLQILTQVATSKVRHLMSAGEPAYKIDEANDNTETQDRKTFMHSKAVEEQVMKDIVQIREGLNDAEVKLGIQMSKHQGWVDGDGTYKTIEEAFADVDPSPEEIKTSGRMRGIRAFIHTTARVLVEAGIPEADVAALNRDGMKTNLANLNRYANRVIESSVPEEKKKRDLEMIVEIGKNCESSTDFLRQAQQYLQPTDEHPGIILYTTNAAGGVVQVICEMTRYLYQNLFLPRLGSRLKEAPAGTLHAAIGLQLLTDAFQDVAVPWNPAQQKLTKVAVHTNLPTSLCLSLLEARPDDDHTLQTIQTNTDLTQYQVKRAMNQLTHYTKDGVTPFATYAEDVDGVGYWRVAL